MSDMDSTNDVLQRIHAAESFSPAGVDELVGCGLDVDDVLRVVKVALTEDLRYGGDVTTLATVPAGAIVEATVAARRPGVLAGLPVALAVFDLVLPGEYHVVRRMADGSRLSAGDAALVVRAPVSKLLTAERTALNFLCHLSGIATLTAAWVAEVAGTGCAIRDTRKTLPGLRLLQKYAVRCGGGVNHRLGLGDAVLVKDNHIAAAGGVAPALESVRSRAADLPCEVEVGNLDELDEALAAGAGLVLLDNFTVEQCAEAVRRTRAAGTGARLEASGGLTLGVARAYAETGVDYLAVGALTHSAPSLDLGLDL